MPIDFDILYNPKQFIQIRSDMHLNVANYFEKKSGFIYLAISKNNNLMKIGRTGKTPLARAESLSSTGVLYDFEILFSLPVLNQFWAETAVHKKLKKYRINKEFFAVNRQFAIDIMENIYNLEEHLLKRYFNVEQLKHDLNDIQKALK